MIGDQFGWLVEVTVEWLSGEYGKGKMKLKLKRCFWVL